MRTISRKGASERAGYTVVRGLVSPAGWDEEGQVSAVCIITDQGQPVSIMPGGAGDRVLAYLKKYVAATGWVETWGNAPLMRVESVELALDPQEPDDWEKTANEVKQ
jgi:hypothetical protein